MALVPLPLAAQTAAQTDGRPLPDSARLEQIPRVPGLATLFRGFDAGLTLTSVHDSSIGWYTLLTPAVSYTFSPRYSADASVSTYAFRLAPNPDQTQAATQALIPTHFDFSDTLLAVHATFVPRAVQNTLTASITVPTGNRQDALGTGRVTFDFRDHVEHYVRQTGLILDVGGGDSSGLFNRLVSKDYSSLGPIAHFQAGLIYWLPGRNYIQTTAYEQLPIGDQKIYTTLFMPGRPPQTAVSGRGVSEDNGFTTLVGVPVTPHVTLSGYYNRSLRLKLDTVSVSLTYVFRGDPRLKRTSLIDRAIREAETSPQ